MSSCAIVTRCLLGSTATTLPFKSKRFSLAGLRRHEVAIVRETRRINKSEVFLLQLFAALVDCRTVVDNSRSLPLHGKRNPYSGKNRFQEHNGLRHLSAIVLPNGRYCQRLHYTKLPPPEVDLGIV